MQSVSLDYHRYAEPAEDEFPGLFQPREDGLDYNGRQIEKALLENPDRMEIGGRACYTFATLIGIRRIGVSRGITGRTRSTNHVSGLHISFWNEDPPIYVGQWFQEVASIELQPDDRITALRFWQSREISSGNNSQTEKGRVTGVEIDTAGTDAKCLQYRLGDGTDVPTCAFTETTSEELVSVIKNIASCIMVTNFIVGLCLGIQPSM